MKGAVAAVGLLVFGFVIFPVLVVLLALFGVNLGLDPGAGCTPFLYLAVGTLGWTIGRDGRERSVAGAGAAIALVAFGLPAALNALTSAREREAAAADRPAPADLEQPTVVAILQPYVTGRDGKWPVETDCTLLCQRLLYSGGMKSVLMGATPADGNPESAGSLVRYRIEERDSCPEVKVPFAGALSGESHVWGSSPTSDAVKSAIANGRCLIAEEGRIAEADLVTMRTDSGWNARAKSAKPGGGIAIWRDEVFAKKGNGWARVARESGREFALVATPLRFTGHSYDLAGTEERNVPLGNLAGDVLKPWAGPPL